MGRYAIDDAKRLREVEAELGVVRESASSAMEWVVPALPSLLGTEKALSISYDLRDEGLGVVPGTTVGISRDIYAFVERWLIDAPVRWAAYNPVHPEPAQRNVVMTTSDLAQLSNVQLAPVALDVYPRFGLANDDMLRVVLTDGPSMLGYVSAFQGAPFEKRQKRMLARIVPALRRRLLKERLLTTAESTRLLLDAAIDHIAAAAFVVGERGAVLETNAVGKLWLERAGVSGRRVLSDVVLSGGDDTKRFHVTKVVAVGVRARYLVVEVATAGSLDAVRSAGLRWRLTRRELEVLVALAKGMATRAIAVELTISERTVETHLTSMFEKAQVETRAELVAKAMQV